MKIGLRNASENPDTVTALDNIVGALYREHRYSEAAAILGQAVDAEQSVLGTDHLHNVPLSSITENDRTTTT